MISARCSHLVPRGYSPRSSTALLSPFVRIYRSPSYLNSIGSTFPARSRLCVRWGFPASPGCKLQHLREWVAHSNGWLWGYRPCSSPAPCCQWGQPQQGTLCWVLRLGSSTLREPTQQSWPCWRLARRTNLLELNFEWVETSCVLKLLCDHLTHYYLYFYTFISILSFSFHPHYKYSSKYPTLSCHHPRNVFIAIPIIATPTPSWIQLWFSCLKSSTIYSILSSTFSAKCIAFYPNSWIFSPATSPKCFTSFFNYPTLEPFLFGVCFPAILELLRCANFFSFGSYFGGGIKSLSSGLKIFLGLVLGAPP